MSAASLGLRLLQPEAHVHIAVQRYCGGEVLADLLLLLCTLIELAKAEVAVGDERAHAERVGERQRLAVVACSFVGAARRRDVTGEAEGVGLACPCPQAAGEPTPLSAGGRATSDHPDRLARRPPLGR